MFVIDRNVKKKFVCLFLCVTTFTCLLFVFSFKLSWFCSLTIANSKAFLQAYMNSLVIENLFYCAMQCQYFAYQFLLQAATESLV